MTENEMMAACEQLCRKFGSLLAGNPPELQGAVLADLTAIWLKGHIVEDDAAATAKLRRDILDIHWKGIWELIDYYDTGRQADG